MKPITENIILTDKYTVKTGGDGLRPEAVGAYRNSFYLYVIAVIILLLAVCVQAKTREYGNVPRGLFGAGEVGRLSVSEIEARFRPFFEERARERRGGTSSGVRGARAARPSERDLFLLMKAWDSLSAEFRALYSEAAPSPNDYDASFISPMGKFKIYYDTAGKNKVDVTDTIGYGVKEQPLLWRMRNSSPNGVPDYIDEAAFALDSTWSMLVDRFNFPNPIAAAGYDYYPIYIKLMDDYGMTYPTVNFPGASVGFFSYIEINSDWSDPDWGVYSRRPYDALRVTCAHEFFHSIQYAMAVDTDNRYSEFEIDDFPVGWLEGSAVLMEEIAYPEINDYFQYIRGFFRNPRISLLSNNYTYKYLNSILFKYLYEKTNPIDSIGFVWTVHDNKYKQASLPFYRNIEQISESYVRKNWAEILNGFHAESYFTGSRARPGVFVTDSDSMDSWAVPAALYGSESKTVKPYSVEFFRYTPQDSHPDTLILNISGQIDNSISGKTWGASVLIMENNDSVGVITVQMNKNGTGRFELAGWKEKSGCLLVVTNASHNIERKVTVTPYSDGFVNPEQEAAVTVSHNIVKLRESTKPISISGGNVTEVKIYSINGKLVWNDKNSANGTVEWRPDKRLTPGTYFMTATSSNPSSGKKRTHKQKIMILP